MKIIYLAIISCLLTGLSPDTSNSRKVSQNIHLNPHIHTLITELDGSVEWVYWHENQVRIETTIQSYQPSLYGLDYAIWKSDFMLIPNYAEQLNTLVLRSKKINPTIIIKGQMQKTKQHYKVFVPANIHCIQ